jgi:Ser/Thr protein kinase RdoA (MazF antagonist)
MTKAGRWIRLFQSALPRGGTESVNGLVEYIDQRLLRLVDSQGSRFTQRDRHGVLKHLARLGAEITPDDLQTVAIHADMAIGNVIVSNGRIVVLDFAMTTHGTRLHDLTRLYVQLDLLCIKPQLRGAVIRVLQRALVEGFDPTLSTQHPLFRMLLLLHRVNHLTTLTVNRARFPESLYNGMVCASHRRWLAAELDRGASASKH